MRQQKIHAAFIQLGIIGLRRKRKPFGGLLLLVNEGFACSFEWNIQRLTKSAQCIVLSCAEGDADGELWTLGEIQPASQGDVAVWRFFVLPIEAIVVSQVGPAIIHADIPTRCFGERSGGPYCEPCISLVCEKKLAIPNV